MEFRILGPVEVWHGARRLAVPGEKQRALLALLLLNANRVLSTEQLIDELWGEEPPQTGTKAVQVRVSQLRRALEAEGITQPVITTRAPGYVVELETDQLDLYRFERLVAGGDEAFARGDPREAGECLREALALWRGPPLAEFDAPFAHSAGARLEELRLAALERRIEVDLALGRHGDLVGELEELIAANPFRERLRAQLMLALYRSGRQAEALQAYQKTRRVLVEELGIGPSQSVQELERAILRQDRSLELELSSERSALASWERPPERSILVVPDQLANVSGLLAVAEPLAKRPGREIILAAVVGEQADLEAVTAALERARAVLAESGVPARVAAFTSNERGFDLVRLASEQDTDLLLIDAPTSLLVDGIPPIDLEIVWREAPCDVAVLVTGEGRGLSLAADRPIIVPFGGGDHEWGAVELGAWIAAAHRATLRLLGSTAKPKSGKRDASRLLAGVSLVVQRAVGISAKPLLVPPGEEAVLAAADDAGLLVLGLSERWSREGVGARRLTLATSARSPTLLVRRGLRPGGLTPPERLTRYTWSLADSGAERGPS
ncbi:MAG: BTAD domain-containing putative transcriptional regulator [Gaiellaceae bacterium]